MPKKNECNATLVVAVLLFVGRGAGSRRRALLVIVQLASVVQLRLSLVGEHSASHVRHQTAAAVHPLVELVVLGVEDVHSHETVLSAGRVPAASNVEQAITTGLLGTVRVNSQHTRCRRARTESN